MSTEERKLIDANESVDHAVEKFRRVADELTENIVSALNELTGMYTGLLAAMREWEQEEEQEEENEESNRAGMNHWNM